MPLRSYWTETHMTGAGVNELSVRNRQHLPLLFDRTFKAQCLCNFYDLLSIECMCMSSVICT